jgi:hypothetical protein
MKTYIDGKTTKNNLSQAIFTGKPLACLFDVVENGKPTGATERRELHNVSSMEALRDLPHRFIVKYEFAPAQTTTLIVRTID